MKSLTTAALVVMLLLVICRGTLASSIEGTEQPSSLTAVSIHMAALEGNIDAIEQHIEAGSDLNEKDMFGSTPLIIAATFGKTEVAKALVEAGADMTIGNNENSTPLHVAAFFGHTDIVRALLDNGADRHVRNITGATPLDIVSAPFDDDKGIYDRLGATLAPLGLKLDYEHIRRTRPEIAEMLRLRPEELEAVEYAPLPGDDWRTSTPAEQGLDPMLVAELYHEAAHVERLYGLLVIKNGLLVAEGYFNDGAVEKKELLQSVAKSYTSALVGIALDQGHLSSVEQNMIDFFPEFAGQITDSRKQQITLRDMLQMRAGYPWEESTRELFDTLYSGFRPSHLVDVSLVSDPGREFNYSNLTSHLLGVVVARACGTDLKSYAEAHLFSPLDVEVGDVWWQDWEGYYIGHGGIRFTARDAAKFGRLYLNDGEYEGNRILSPDWIRESLETYTENANSGAPRSGRIGRYFRDIGYGYQWWSARVGDHHFNYAAGHGGILIVLLDEFDMVIVVTSDPFLGQHDAEAWKHEQANFNLVGKFIKHLPKVETDGSE
ncbi:MAG: serine hydrolase [Candidatus Eiseniibacteriota bacterium]|nr:MAG: serine hydrolase [Candidatus Eisenbacteria bacterium]